jgi:hypothetical protein
VDAKTAKSILGYRAMGGSPLAELIAPLSEAEFLSLLSERKLAHRRSCNGTRYTTWMDWEAVRRLLERGEHPSGRDDIRVTKESIAVPKERWCTGDAIDVAKLEKYLADGFSVVITHFDPYIPPLASLCVDIKSRFSERAFAGVIVTTGADGAFKIHYDPEDLLILQIEGTKRWQIFGPPVSNPVTGMPKQTPPSPDSEPIFDEVVEPGDLLFVPGGNWHHCQARPGRSVHLGILITPPTAWHAVNSLISQLVVEEMFRKPLTRIGAASGLSEIEIGIKTRLIEKLSQLNLSDFVGEWARKRRQP